MVWKNNLEKPQNVVSRASMAILVRVYKITMLIGMQIVKARLMVFQMGTMTLEDRGEARCVSF